MTNAAHLAKIRGFLEEARAAKDRRLVMVFTRELKALALGHLTNR